MIRSAPCVTSPAAAYDAAYRPCVSTCCPDETPSFGTVAQTAHEYPTSNPAAVASIRKHEASIPLDFVLLNNPCTRLVGCARNVQITPYLLPPQSTF